MFSMRGNNEKLLVVENFFPPYFQPKERVKNASYAMNSEVIIIRLSTKNTPVLYGV